MNRTALIAAAAAAALTLAASAPAQAQTYAQSPWSAIGATTLSTAIRNIEVQTGGKVMEIRFRTGALGDPRYDAVVAKGTAISRVAIGIHPEDRVIVMSEEKIPAWEAGWTARADKRSLTKAKVDLADAVRSASRMTGGVAVDAALAAPLTASNAVLAYNIEVVKDGGDPMRVAIDAQTGSPIANPDALLAAWTPEHSIRHALRSAAADR